ncbi:hypothetical protein SHELI_v1c09220 [Spiroplasma helicoides]|uniref:Lipoprotein n=1 Tax=Spiroplasma helicoides TaxID=216938 RepID=A0A1B3SLR1_9MOLU|nr:hypothetical protein [Spiroplasma helicoides]AOG60871.1 hypothetical protein SHELI_v1c09220 [Spiroplasma helicoides]
MKKLLSLIASLSLLSTLASNAISCNKNTGTNESQTNQSSSSNQSDNNKVIDQKISLESIAVKELMPISNSIDDAKNEAKTILKRFRNDIKEKSDYEFLDSYFSRSTPLYSGWITVRAITTSKIVKGEVTFTLKYVDDRKNIAMVDSDMYSRAGSEEEAKNLFIQWTKKLSPDAEINIDYTMGDIYFESGYGYGNGYYYTSMEATRDSIFLKGSKMRISVQESR